MISKIVPISIFLLIFGAHMNILMKVEILVLIKWSYRSL